MTIGLKKIGDPTIESPRDFPVDHDANVDLIEQKFVELDDETQDIRNTFGNANQQFEARVQDAEEDIDLLKQRVGTAEQTVVSNSNSINNLNQNLSDSVDSLEQADDQLQQYVDTSIQALSASLNAEGIEYSNPSPDYSSIQNVKDALDYLLYFEVAINSFNLNVGVVSGPTGTVLEVGQVVNTRSFNWTLNKSSDFLTALTLSNIGATLSLSDTTFSTTDIVQAHSGSSASFGGSQFSETYQLSVTDDQGAVDTSNRSITWRFSRFFGTSSVATLSQGDLGDLSSELSNSNSKTFTVNATGGKYIYFVYPSRFGALNLNNIVIGGLSNNAWTQQTINITNSYGVEEQYFAYRSNDLQNGSSITVEI